MLKEAMYKRHSRRSYLREKLRDEDAAFLKERIHMYNQKHGLHMKLVCGHPEIFKGFRNSYGMFHNVENFIMMMGNSRDGNLLGWRYLCERCFKALCKGR